MRILITGGTGLVGTAISNIKDNYNYEFIFMSSKDCDLINYNITYKYIKDRKPDVIIHLAAFVGGLYRNMNDKSHMLENNLLMNYNIINICHKLNIKKVISCLSTCIFPDKIEYPIDETMLHMGPPHDSNDVYAYSKRMLEIHSRMYNEHYKDNFVSIIPTNIYGENDFFSL